MSRALSSTPAALRAISRTTNLSTTQKSTLYFCGPKDGDGNATPMPRHYYTGPDAARWAKWPYTEHNSTPLSKNNNGSAPSKETELSFSIQPTKDLCTERVYIKLPKITEPPATKEDKGQGQTLL